MNKNHIGQLALALVLMASHIVAHAGVCEYADTTYAKISTGLAGAGVATGIGLNVAGVTALAHSSGAAIAATASSGYLAGTLGTVGTVVGFVTAPATLVVGGVAVVAAGGTIAYCHYTKDERPGVPARPASAHGKAK
ncbi:hypothetical protein [Sulfurirhabdus autotrophica]|uniref:Uncharacterized protein n=1 Tax=Sulfurirhabdus autotrophica TaxID=1706046 RepID=A0A4R3YE46_9PROT|nr:hypothetical protein [Sulfurirhabdus autotrophica]TCV90346.1 hypothetical protein EDC63_101316 [Sulfurirhabdus autotrophica]